MIGRLLFATDKVITALAFRQVNEKLFFRKEIRPTSATQHFFSRRFQVDQQCLIIGEVFQCVQQKVVLLKHLSQQYAHPVAIAHILKKQHVCTLLCGQFLNIRFAIVQANINVKPIIQKTLCKNYFSMCRVACTITREPKCPKTSENWLEFC